MKVLMISADRWFLDSKDIGDVKERHRHYGNHVESIDIIVQNIYKGKYNKLSSNVRVYPTNSMSKLFYIRDTKKVYKKYLKENKYDLIVTQDPFLTGLAGVFLKRHLHAKLLVHLHGDFIDNRDFLNERIVNRLLLIIALRVLKKVDAIRVMSEKQKTKLLKKGYAALIECIATPIDLELFKSAKPFSIKEWTTIITMVGRKDKVKDFQTLFDAMQVVFKQCSNVGLYLVGNFSDDKDVPLPANRLRLFGEVSGSEMPAIYATSDVIVLSSTSESFGKVLVEANAAGKPVVTTATTGGEEIVKDGYNGFIVPKKNSQALALKIIELVKNPGFRKIMGDNGKKLVTERYSNNTMKVIHFWETIVRHTI